MKYYVRQYIINEHKIQVLQNAAKYTTILLKQKHVLHTHKRYIPCMRSCVCVCMQVNVCGLRLCIEEAQIS